MVKIFTAQWLYTFPWSQVVSGFWQKFPNPYTGHVLSEDTYYRHLTPDNVLISKRIITKTNKLPNWGERYFQRTGGTALAFILEESSCDLNKKIFTTITKNITMTSIMVVEEKCVYHPDSEDSSRTVCDKTITAQGELFGFRTTLETFAVKRYRKSQELMSLGLEYILYKLYKPDLLKTITTTTPPLPPTLADKAKHILHSAKPDKKTTNA